MTAREKELKIGRDILQLLQEIAQASKPGAQLCRYPPSNFGLATCSLSYEDIKRLQHVSTLGKGKQHYSYLNGDVIDFYLQYILNVVYTKSKEKIDILPSMFFEQLKRFFTQPNAPRRTLMKRNLFEKDFVLIPIATANHWILGVICYPNLINFNIEKFIRSSDELRDDAIKRIKSKVCYPFKCCPSIDNYGLMIDESMKRPCIMVLTSYDHRIFRRAALIVYVRVQRFLEILWEKFYGEGCLSISFNENNFPFYYPNCPKQRNAVDCGVYVLHFSELIIANPEILQRLPPNFINWFKPEDVRDKRLLILKLCKAIFLQEKVTDICICTKDVMQNYFKNVYESEKNLDDLKFPITVPDKMVFTEIEENEKYFNVNFLLQLLCDLNIIEIVQSSEPPPKRCKIDVPLNPEDESLLSILSALINALSPGIEIKIVKLKSLFIQRLIYDFITKLNEIRNSPDSLENKHTKVKHTVINFFSFLEKQREERVAAM